jgi:hypothetical protein
VTSPDPTAAGETGDEWQLYLDGFNETFQPVGIPESELVYNLAICLWRKRRIVRAERGSIDQLHARIDEQGVHTNMTRAEQERLIGRHRMTTLPDLKRLEILIRYEAQIDRSFARTLEQLELIQRLRSGQNVPAPVRIQVSNDQPEGPGEAQIAS